MERLKINVHPTFVVFAILLVYFGQGFLFLNYLVTIFLHEYAHALVAKKLGYKIKDIKLIPFGICLNMKSSIVSPKDEIKIAIAGPLMNLVLCVLSFSVWWIAPAVYNYTYLFCYANLVTFLFNLLPAFPLDGGRILLAVLRSKSREVNATKLCKAVNIILGVILLGLFVWSCFKTINLTYLFVTFCVLSGVFDVNEKRNYQPLNFCDIKKVNKVLKIKNLYVKDTEKIFVICKFLDNFSYLNLYVYDEKENLKAIIAERDFVSLIEKVPSTSTFKDVLSSP
jgi:Zn-dependent protease